MCCIKKYFSLLLNSCIFSNLFIVSGDLLNNLMPTFPLLVLKRVVLQKWVWRSDFWCVQWSCSSPLYFIFSKCDFTQHTTSLTCIYRQGKGSMFRSLKRFLQETCRPTLPIILITFICNQKIFILAGSPPHRVKPYLKWTWKHAKYMVLKTCGLITFFKDLIK
jgi:hypothetical protein